MYLALDSALVMYSWEASSSQLHTSEKSRNAIFASMGNYGGYWAATSMFWSIMTLQNAGVRFWLAASIGVARMLVLIAF